MSRSSAGKGGLGSLDHPWRRDTGIWARAAPLAAVHGGTWPSTPGNPWKCGLGLAVPPAHAGAGPWQERSSPWHPAPPLTCSLWRFYHLSVLIPLWCSVRLFLVSLQLLPLALVSVASGSPALPSSARVSRTSLRALSWLLWALLEIPRPWDEILEGTQWRARPGTGGHGAFHGLWDREEAPVDMDWLLTAWGCPPTVCAPLFPGHLWDLS